MTSILTPALAFLTGGVLGAIFFGGLWWTIRKGIPSKRTAAWFMVSLFLRMAVALTGFYLVGHDHWKRMLVCLAGFFVARLVVTRLNRPQEANETHTAGEATHAS